MRSTSCPRCKKECPELEIQKHRGTMYECYKCRIYDRPLQWYWESAQIWEPIEAGDQQPEEGMVKVIMAMDT